MRLEKLVRASAMVAATPGRLEKISKLADLFRRVPPDDLPIAIGFLTGSPRLGRHGVGSATVASAEDRQAATASTLDLRDVASLFDQLLPAPGKNSTSERARLLGDLFFPATAAERVL